MRMLVIFIGVMIVYGIAIYIFQAKKKGDSKKWFEENPTASKVYLSTKTNVVRTNSLQILSVDGKLPVYFYEGIRLGIYLLPGDHVIEATFVTSRRGILYKRVTTDYGVSKQEVTVEKGKTYTFTFDIKSESYEFIEE